MVHNSYKINFILFFILLTYTNSSLTNNKKDIINNNTIKKLKYNKIISQNYMISKNTSNYDYINFSEKEDDDGFLDWIKDHKAETIIIVSGIIVFIALVIIIIFCTLKMNQKIKRINGQISKISFKNDDIRHSSATIIDDDLLI